MSQERATVYVDGSFRQGRGGIGLAGSFGLRARAVRCASSSEAELAAITWALEIATALGVARMTLRSDYVEEGNLRARAVMGRKKHRPLAKLLVVAIHRALLTHPNWQLLDASSREVREAHRLARRGSAPHAPREILLPAEALL